MPARTSLFDFGTRNFICRSCRSNLQKSAQWPVRYSSQTVQAHAPPKSNHETPDQDNERLKTLQALGLLDNGPKISVNYFEEGKRGRLRRLHNQDEFSESLTDPGGEMGARLKELEQQLEQATQLVKAIEEIGGKEETNRLRQQFAFEPDSRSQAAGVENNLQPPTGLRVVANDLSLKKCEIDALVRLNKYIQVACNAVDYGRVTSRVITKLWGGYSRLRQIILRRWASVPPAAWDFLWNVLSVDENFNPNRMPHIFHLAKDMHQLGVTLRPEQQLLAIEAMFVNGWKEEAIENYKRNIPKLGTNPEISLEFWQLGLRMYCLTGDLEQAEQIIDTILESPQEKDPRFLMPYIRACAQSPETVEKAFEAYRRLQAALGDPMVIEDYDQVISYFLIVSQVDYALYVFVDMMKAGTIDLYRKRYYPHSVLNPFFFGKWVKRLLVNGDLEGAHKVFLFMRTKSIVPMAIQVNGLLGAWFRSGLAGNVQKAEDMAWLMINSRIQFVQMRRRDSALGDRVLMQRSGDGWPNATIETFCLLAENYKIRGIHSKMEELWKAFREAEIAPDVMMMNQLLFSYLQDGQGEHVAPVYRGLARKYSIKPDPRTFMALWQALPINRLSRVLPSRFGKEIPNIRTLFAEMMKFAPVFEEGVDVFLARRILHSFRKVDDTIGLLLALRALRQILGFTPPEAVAFEILVGSEDLERTAKGRGWNRLVDARARADRYLKHKQQELVQSGELKAGDSLAPEMIKEETSNFLELRLEAQISPPKENADHIEKAIKRAAQEMGLYDEDGPNEDGPDKEVAQDA
ncbi:hypothetical protein F5X99DRAFT_381614 [Biscogniauxia marginata]|nr:hypothetical protein F5X99DRAFT_381614 [Biscogniauxia marginata]